ncbi:methylated-DNA--[protein]-cysteine S-methyltransferase [bacterium]|nr:methylated-DNA--[protein]-cysteine S-methyltransferase [bacterium]
MNESLVDYERIERAIVFIEKNYKHQPSLKAIADHVYLSEFHFQRLFKKWVGITPKQFLKFITKEHAKALLNQSRSMLDVTFETGLSSPGRLHDLFLTCEAVTPGEFKQKGKNMTIYYGKHPSPFGSCLILATDRGICGLSFGGGKNDLKEYREHWAGANFQENLKMTDGYARKIFKNKRSGALKVHLMGTKFQIKVWEALLRIPVGSVASYEDVAALISDNLATRAVASAVARNPVAYLIPCHRVIRKIGVFGNYHWGSARKKAILAWECAQFGEPKALENSAGMN